MSATCPADVNYWFDRRCARAFWSQSEAPPYHELLRHTSEWLDPQAGERWLDLGCGSGKLTRVLWERSGGALSSIVAVDCAEANREALEQVRQSCAIPHHDHRIRFQQGDLSFGLGSFADASLDGVVSGLAIQYAQSWSAELGRWTDQAYDGLLVEVHRVLRPGGRFIFSVNVPNPDWLRVAFHGVPGLFRSARPLRLLRNSLRMMRYGSWLKREAARGRFHYLESSTIHTKLALAGFTRIEHRSSYSGQAYLFRAYKSTRASSR